MHDFTADQQAAIAYLQRDACVVAGPGSGKTTVLVERYRRLIEDEGFSPKQILAITFTLKAAANMQAKVAEKFEGDEARLRELELAWISTIHGFCARFLRENAIAAGIDPKFTVLDARQAEDLQFATLNVALDEMVAQRRDEALELINALQTPRITGDLKDAYDGLRSAGMAVDQVRRMKSPGAQFTRAYVAQRMRDILANWPERRVLSEARKKHHDYLAEWAQRFSEGIDEPCRIRLNACPESSKDELEDFRENILPAYAATKLDGETAHLRAIVFDVLERFETLYQKEKDERGALDFNDLERRTIELLRSHEDVRARCCGQFRQVMLDEFQDINEQQAELIGLIRADDVFFAVGDINQSIYGFRHARPQIFRDYRDQIVRDEKQSTELFDNFRSRDEILRCVEGMLNSAEGIESHSLVAGKAFGAKSRPSIEVLRIMDSAEDDEAGVREARWIAERVVELRTGEVDFRNFAVLCRSHDAMQPILREFDRIGIPYVCGRRESYLVSREGLDIRALLGIVANAQDGIALATVLRSDLVGVSDEALLRLKTVGGSVASGLYRELTGLGAEDRDKIERFAGDLRRWRTQAGVVPLDLLIVRMLSDCGVEWVPGSVSGNNIEAFLHLARTTGARGTLLEFLAELESIEKAIAVESELSDADQGNAVQVMTAHAAKGLEFAVTIVAAMHKGTQRSGNTVTFTPENGIGLRWKDEGNSRGNGLKDSWSLANSERLKQRETEEENRLLYVAMTRAEQHLILSYSREKNRPSHWAKRVEEYFGLDGWMPSAEWREVERKGFRAAVLVTDSDPAPVSVYGAEQRDAAEIAVIARPRPEDQQDSAVNVTSLAVFAGCPRKYYLSRSIGWAGVRTGGFDPEEYSEPDVSAAELGSMVHEVLAGKSGEYPAEAMRLADVFRRSELGQRAAAAKCVEREWEFIAELGGTLVRGSVDLWFEDGGEICLVDYKTDAAAKPDDYAPQLALYALAIERAFGRRPARAYLHFLKPDVVAEVALDSGSLEGALRLIGDLGVAQNSLDFGLREGRHCYSCSFYKSLCPAQVGQGSLFG